MIFSDSKYCKPLEFTWKVRPFVVDSPIKTMIRSGDSEVTMNVYMNYPDILTIKSAVVQVLFANLAKTEPEDRYPLVNVYITMENHHFIAG